MNTEVRIAIPSPVYEDLVRFFQDGLGLQLGPSWQQNGRGQTFPAGDAVVEVLDEEHARFVEREETGDGSPAGLRLAIRVPDVDEAVARARAYGARLVSAARLMPWGDYNARIEAPGGLAVTLFQAGNG